MKNKCSQLCREKVDKLIIDCNDSNKFWFDACELKEQVKTILKHIDRHSSMTKRKNVAWYT